MLFAVTELVSSQEGIRLILDLHLHSGVLHGKRDLHPLRTIPFRDLRRQSGSHLARTVAVCPCLRTGPAALFAFERNPVDRQVSAVAMGFLTCRGELLTVFVV